MAVAIRGYGYRSGGKAHDTGKVWLVYPPAVQGESGYFVYLGTGTNLVAVQTPSKAFGTPGRIRGREEGTGIRGASEAGFNAVLRLYGIETSRSGKKLEVSDFFIAGYATLSREVPSRDSLHDLTAKEIHALFRDENIPTNNLPKARKEA